MRLFLFDDQAAKGWTPFALTRPVGEILFGALSLRGRIERATRLHADAYLGRADLVGFEEAGAPGVLPTDGAVGEGVRLILSTRYVPPIDRANPLALSHDVREAGVRLVAKGNPVGWLLPNGTPTPSANVLAQPGSAVGGVALDLPGEVLSSPWDLVARNADQLRIDLPNLFGASPSAGEEALPWTGVHRIGEHGVTWEEGAQVDPAVLLDTRDGPVHLGAGVQVRSFTHLRGPAWIGSGTLLLGGTIEAVSVGGGCKLRGEVSESVIIGHTNKAHDGYLGHSLVGRWVNLGAFTTNSDLKNNYGQIRVAADGGEVDSGLLKVGVFLGDHVKTGIGTRLGAGTSIGAGSNLYGSGMAPKWVPPFAWWDGTSIEAYRLEAFLSTAEKAMARRGVQLTDGQRALFTRLSNAASDAR
jgi:UDP-N-acetylglucosamine diphosphorylase/glucosamine-1-phosphate N-acetyltransferase